jgi:hydroxymethylglutaryl-CoA reductase (NADPH)
MCQSRIKSIRKNYDSESVYKKIDYLEAETGTQLKHIRCFPYDTELLRGNIENPIGFAHIPLGFVGPINVAGEYAQGKFNIPMATTEGALILTYDLGARLLFDYPINVKIISKVIHISPMFILKESKDSICLKNYINNNFEIIKNIAESTSGHLQLLRIDSELFNDLLILRFCYDSCDAQGLNMINQATYQACLTIEKATGIFFYLRSHYSGVKHHCPLNEKIGYGIHVKASVTIPASILRYLKVEAKQFDDFLHRCIACGNHAGIENVNVHAANGMTAIYLACGQDCADISSCHVVKDDCKVIEGHDLYWEVDIPNLLVGTVGGGTVLGSQMECLQIMQCYGDNKVHKFAEIIAATVLCGEFTTAAAVVNRSYVDVHNKYGRNKKPKM